MLEDACHRGIVAPGRVAHEQVGVTRGHPNHSCASAFPRHLLLPVLIGQGFLAERVHLGVAAQHPLPGVVPSDGAIDLHEHRHRGGLRQHPVSDGIRLVPTEECGHLRVAVQDYQVSEAEGVHLEVLRRIIVSISETPQLQKSVPGLLVVVVVRLASDDVGDHVHPRLHDENLVFHLPQNLLQGVGALLVHHQELVLIGVKLGNSDAGEEPLHVARGIHLDIVVDGRRWVGRH
mmetsp:Transcript_95225/g.254629  ORF Transcript_95225/g.254629 Transcript_95225/m.254629 type:complete len:233 (+) Transcript_95225:965-1663(+)